MGVLGCPSFGHTGGRGPRPLRAPMRSPISTVVLLIAAWLAAPTVEGFVGKFGLSLGRGLTAAPRKEGSFGRSVSGASAGPRMMLGPRKKVKLGGEWLSESATKKEVDTLQLNEGIVDGGRYAVCSQEGRGKGTQVGGPLNQDSATAGQLTEGMALLGVFDGHGQDGGTVSQYVAANLPPKIATIEDTLRRAGAKAELALGSLTDVFMECHKELCDPSSGVSAFISGSTGLTVCVMSDPGSKRLVVANAGDCRCVLASKGWGGKLTATQLSQDQNPDRADERKRIEGLGGVVGMVDDAGDPPMVYSPDDVEQNGWDLGPARVFWEDGTWDPPFHEFFPGLAMARSFGDQCLDELGVEPIPEVLIHTIKPKDKFMVIASDGVWQVLSNEEVVGAIAGNEDNVAQACEACVKLAAEKWDNQGGYRDDITCVLLTFDAPASFLAPIPVETCSSPLARKYLRIRIIDHGHFLGHPVPIAKTRAPASLRDKYFELANTPQMRGILSSTPA